MRLATAFLLLGLALSPPAAAQVSFTGEYYQDFEDLGTEAQAALPPGWRAAVYPTVQEPGTYADAGTASDLRGGSFFIRDRPTGIVNFGSGPEDTAPERALGVALRGGETQTGVLYVRFRNDTGSQIESLQTARSRESYRGGGTIVSDTFLSRDGATWEPIGGAGNSSINGFFDGAEFPPIGGGSGGTDVALTDPIPEGGEWYIAYRFYTTSTAGAAPAQALDQVSIVSPPNEANVIFLTHGPREFGPVFLGEVGFGGASFDLRPANAPDGIAEVTGPHASDFIVTEVRGSIASQFVRIEFRPTAHGWRDAELRLFAADTVSRPVALRGFGVDAGSTDAEQDATATAVRLDAWPNPSTGPVRLRAQTASPGPVRLSVHDALGRELAVVLDRALPAGTHDATFDPEGLAPGIYFTRLVTAQETVTTALTIGR